MTQLTALKRHQTSMGMTMNSIYPKLMNDYWLKWTIELVRTVRAKCVLLQKQTRENDETFYYRLFDH